MRTILSFAVVVLAGAAGEIAIAHAMKQIGEVHSFSLRVLAGVLRRAIRMVWLWIGVVLIALGFFSGSLSSRTRTRWTSIQVRRRTCPTSS